MVLPHREDRIRCHLTSIVEWYRLAARSIRPEEDDSVDDRRPDPVEGCPLDWSSSYVDSKDHLPDLNHKVFPMSSFGWIAAGHRLLLSPWLRRRGVSKPGSRKATVGLESLESIDLMSHASLALAKAHLEALQDLTQKRLTAEVHRVTSPTTKAAKTVAIPAQTITAEQTISQTATQSVTVPSTLTNIVAEPFAPPINLFNPSLGTLTDVSVTESASLTSNITSQNTSTSSGADITGELSGNFTISGIDQPFSGTIQAFTQTVHVPASLNGANDFLPPTTVTFPPLTGSQTQTFNYTLPADLDAFTSSPGRTTITPVLDANAISTATAPNGNLQSRVMTEGQGTITISYSYIPTGAPQILNVVRYGIHHQPTTLVVTFGGPVNASDVSNPANYNIVLPNKYGGFKHDTTNVGIASATYDATTNTAILVASKRINFHHLAELEVTLPSDDNTVLTSVFGGLKDLGGYQNPYNKSQLITYVPGVTVLPS